MPIVNAVDYGSKVQTSPYGERYDFVSDGNGDTENDLLVEARDDVDQRLYDIAAMRSAIMTNPMEGDDFLLACIDMDEMLIKAGRSEEMLIDTYPEFPDRIQGLVREIAVIGELDDLTIPPKMTMAEFQKRVQALIDSELISQYQLQSPLVTAE